MAHIPHYSRFVCVLLDQKLSCIIIIFYEHARVKLHSPLTFPFRYSQHPNAMDQKNCLNETRIRYAVPVILNFVFFFPNVYYSFGEPKKCQIQRNNNIETRNANALDTLTYRAHNIAIVFIYQVNWYQFFLLNTLNQFLTIYADWLAGWPSNFLVDLFLGIFTILMVALMPEKYELYICLHL